MKYPASLKSVDTRCQSETECDAGLLNGTGDALLSRLVWIYPVVAGLVLVLFAGEARYGIPFSFFTQDPLVVAKGRAYFGLLSNLGILCWCAAATVCLFTWVLLKSSAHARNAGFFLFSGILTLMLTLDDLFQLHEEVFPNLLGIRQRYVLLCYLLLTAAYLVIYRRKILSRHAVFMVAALAMFTLSVAEDATSIALIMHNSLSLHYLVEDGSKLFGIISWFVYFVSVSSEEIRLCIDNNPI